MIKRALYYGVYGTRVCKSLVTPDKQLHAGPGLITDEESFWPFICSFMVWIQNQCQEEFFTLVLDVKENFKNDYWDSSAPIGDQG